MFTCEKCHREKPEHECVRLYRGVSFVIGLMVLLLHIASDYF